MFAITCNGFVLLAALVVSLMLWYHLVRLRFDHIGQPWSTALGFIHAALTVASVVALWPPSDEVYREVPHTFLFLWVVILAGSNAVLAAGFYNDRLAHDLNATLGNWIRRGGFWGNHFSSRYDEDWVGTRDNGWAAWALAFALLVTVSWWMQGSLPPPPTAVDRQPSALQQLSAGAEQLYTGTNTPVEAALRWWNSGSVARTARAIASTDFALPAYPKSRSWFWLTLFAIFYALFANVWCRRDGVAAGFERIGSWFQWRRRRPSVVSGVSTPAPMPTPAPAAVATTTATPAHGVEAPAAAQSGSIKGVVEAVIGPLKGLAREVTKEAVAEGIWETIPRTIAGWLKKK